ncbi:MAG: hypothetical protein HYR85_00810 [Planctomycetes bacterium]|nr:hypothetical protein [Planctomycetota bacterium]
MSLRPAILQGAFVALAVFLVATVALEWFAGRVPGVRDQDLVDHLPDRARAFVADVSPDSQIILKSFYDFGAGDEANDRALAARIGQGAEPLAFLVLLAVDFGADRPLDLRIPSGSVKLRLRDGRVVEHRNLASVASKNASPDAALWSSAFGIPDGDLRIAPRSLRKFVIAFSGSFQFSEVESVSMRREGSNDLTFRRLDLPKTELDAFLEAPQHPLGTAVAVAKEPR